MSFRDALFEHPHGLFVDVASLLQLRPIREYILYAFMIVQGRDISLILP